MHNLEILSLCTRKAKLKEIKFNIIQQVYIIDGEIK